MAAHGRMTVAKRLRERALAERRRDKLARRLEASKVAQPAEEHAAGIDPDLAGIVPGPQPLQSWQTED